MCDVYDTRTHVYIFTICYVVINIVCPFLMDVTLFFYHFSFSACRKPATVKWKIKKHAVPSCNSAD